MQRPAGDSADDDPEIGLVDAIVLGLVEGITEFLPVSSTGHLIVAQRALGIGEGPVQNTFVVGVQIGAITAILVLYWRRLWNALAAAARRDRARTEPNLLVQIAVAAAPAAVLGLLLADWLDDRLFSPGTVAATMVGGGVLLLALERWLRGAPPGAGTALETMSYRAAAWIGVFQCLALVPGTSRSAATIAGALVLGLSRVAAAEFSFLVGLPILYGAGALKLWQNSEVLHGALLAPFLVAVAVSFVTALVVVRPFVQFVRMRTFAPFALYRIAAGLGLAVLCWYGVVA